MPSLPLDLLSRWLGTTPAGLRTEAETFKRECYETIKGATRDGLREVMSLYPAPAAPFGQFLFDRRAGITARATLIGETVSVVLFETGTRQGKITGFGVTSPNPVASWIVCYTLLINNQTVTDYQEVRDSYSSTLSDLVPVSIDLQPGARVEIQATTVNIEGLRSPEQQVQATARIKGYLI